MRKYEVFVEINGLLIVLRRLRIFSTNEMELGAVIVDIGVVSVLCNSLGEVGRSGFPVPF